MICIKKNLGSLVTAAAFSSCLVFGWTASSRAEGEMVKAVQIEQNRAVSSTALLPRIRTKAGVEFSQEVLNEDIKRLYATGFFNDVKVDLQDEDDGITVTFIVSEKPSLTGIHFRGNRVFREKKLREVIHSKEGSALDRQQLTEDLIEIERLYKEKGYARVRTTHELVTDEETGNSELTILIDEGPRVRIKEIRFAGNEHYSRKKLMKWVKTRRDTLLTSGFVKKEEIRVDIERLKALYESEGYLDVLIREEWEEKNDGRSLILTFDISEGTRYFLGDISIEGNQLYPEAELQKLIKVQSGDPFSREKIREDLNRIKEFYYDRGHIFAEIDADTVVERQIVSLAFRISEKEVAYVDKVNIRGNTKTKDIVIRRELRIKPGERYDGGKIRRSKERLYNLGYFETVSFDTEEGSEPEKRDLAVSVKEAKTGEFSFGAGFSSVDKLLGFVQVAQNNFDIANPPTFTGDGQKLALRANLGTVRRDYELSFTEPWIFDYPLLFGVDVYNRTILKEGDIGFGFDEERRGGDLRLGKEFREYLRGDMIYRLERIDISDVSSDATNDLKSEVGQNTISSLATHLTRDTRDNIFSPTRGYTVTGSLETAGGLLGQDKDFVKWVSNGAVYFPTWEKLILEFHLRGGWASEFGDSKDVPIYERFFAGGANTVRGYRERRIGPRDPNTNDPIGGKAMLIANAEYTFPIVEVLKGAVFYDTGNVWRRAGDIGTGTFRSGTGLGVRIKTPIGPVKLDWGYPLNPSSGEDDKGRFHFNISRGF